MLQGPCHPHLKLLRRRGPESQVRIVHQPVRLESSVLRGILRESPKRP
jgi:hypothetical protein